MVDGAAQRDDAGPGAAPRPDGLTEPAAPATVEEVEEEARPGGRDAELEVLRGELSTLRARYAALEQSLGRRRGLFSLAPGSTGRRWLSTLLVLLAIVLTPLSVVGVWTKATLTDTNRYVDTVAPLASDPAIQAAITNRITDQIYANVDVEAVVSEVLPPAAQALAGPLSVAVRGFIHQVVGAVVASSQFEAVWRDANRAVHTQVVGALEGTSPAGLAVKNGEVTLDLGQLVTAAKERLVAAGLTAAGAIPTNRISGSFVLFQSAAVTHVQWAFRALEAVGTWLPVVVLALLLAGVWLARDRRRALLGAGVGITVLMLAAGGAVALVRSYYLSHLPATVSKPAAAAALDIVLHFLRQAYWAMVVLGILVAVAAFLAGPSVSARAVRTAAGTGMSRLGDRVERAGGLPPGLRTFVGRYRRAWEAGVVVVAVVVLLLWRGRTVAVELWTVFVTVLALLLVELVARRPELEGAEGPGTPAGPDARGTGSSGAEAG